MSQKLFVIIVAGLRLVALGVIVRSIILLIAQIGLLGAQAPLMPVMVTNLVPVVGGVLAWAFSKVIASIVLTGLD